MSAPAAVGTSIYACEVRRAGMKYVVLQAKCSGEAARRRYFCCGSRAATGTGSRKGLPGRYTALEFRVASAPNRRASVSSSSTKGRFACAPP